MKHKGNICYFLHPGDLKRYRKEKDFKWEDIRKIAYYPEELAEQRAEEERLQKGRKKPDDENYVEMTEEEVRKMIDEYLNDDDQVFEDVKKMVNQRKVQRVVINLPGWLKKRLKEISMQKGASMNAIVRLALTEYLSKEE